MDLGVIDFYLANESLWAGGNPIAGLQEKKQCDKVSYLASIFLGCLSSTTVAGICLIE